jgi:3-deoxy-D-manno-octulosonate 8-phosphate phosphatase (KDO 8-P phosphatase)
MPLASADELDDRCAGIELLVLDVDGVLTDGVIAVDDRGVETKHFHVRDGGGIALWRRAGKRVAIVSGRSARCVEVRAAELGIAPVVQGATDKAVPFGEILGGFGLGPDQVCTMGDDLADLPILGVSGLAACPSDSAPEVVASAHYVAVAAGGRGAVREVIELILGRQGLWAPLVEGYRRGA